MSQALSRLIVGKKEDISDELLLLNPYQIPVLDLVGFSSPVMNTQYGWVEDKLQAMKDTVKIVEGSAGSSSITVNTPTIFRPDQVIKIGDELILVTAVNEGTGVLTVTRGFGGTTTATSPVAKDTEIEIMFNLKDEGSDARDSKYIPRVNLFNYTQIFDDTIKISGTAQAVSEYGISDLYNYERMKVQDRLALELENALVNGVKFQSGDKRMMGGLRSFITTNVTNAASAEITFEMIDNAMLSIVKAGGMKEATRMVLMVSPTQLQKITLLDKAQVRVGRAETVTGREVKTFVTPHGTLEIRENINFKSDEVAILDANRIKIRPLQGRQFSHTYLGMTGDNIKGQVVGEFTLELNQEEAHAWIKGLKTA